jgi:hypothetical protein
MRRKKHKQTRRAVSFYKINYNLHEPYKVRFSSTTKRLGCGACAAISAWACMERSMR